MIEARDGSSKILWSHGYDSNSQRQGVTTGRLKVLEDVKASLKLALSQVKFEIKCLDSDDVK
jgi:hypothetical protein